MNTSVALKRITNPERHFIVTREFDSLTTFYEKYRPKYWQLKEAIQDGNIATHCINGRNRINVVEALQFLWPNSTYEIIVPVKEEKNDLF